MSDATKSVAPNGSALTREQFLTRWDNNAGAQTVGDIDNLVITPAEIAQGGGIIEFAKDFERIAPTARANIVLEISEPERAKLAQAVHNVRFRYYDPTGNAGAQTMAQRYQLKSWTARQHIQQATAFLVENGFKAEDVKGTQVVTDPLGITHIRFDRMAYGRPMYGEQLVVHVGKDGSKTVSGATLPTPAVDGDATAESLEQVLAEAVKRFGVEPAEVKVQESVIRDGDKATLGWVIELRNFERQDDGPRSMIFIVDGKDNKFIDAFKGVGSGIVHPEDVAHNDGFIAAFETSGGIVPPTMRAQGEQAAQQEPAKVTASIKSLVQTLARQEAEAPEKILSAKVEKTGDDTWAVKVEEPKARPQRPARPLAPVATQDPEPAKPTQEEPHTMDRFKVPLDHLMTGPGDDYVPYSARVDLATTKQGSQYALRAESWQHDGIETRDAKQGWSASGAVLIKDDDDTWSQDDEQAQRSGAAAHYGAMMTYRFLREMGFNSIDLQGEQLVSNVNIRRNYVNAYWDGKAMHYGEGDGRTAGPLTTLDIAGHEIAHGLTERTAGLIYRNESGGMNESYSDIAGFMVEYYASKLNPSVTPDWTMGEDTWTPKNGDHRDGLRYMDDPSSDKYSVEHYSLYPRQTEVHGSSGIQNNAFYQLAYPDNRTKKANKVSGVAVEDGIGVEKAARIFFRALAYYLTPNATFAEGRAACIQAAKDLYGVDSVEAQKTAEAWSAVGVEDPT